MKPSAWCAHGSVPSEVLLALSFGLNSEVLNHGGAPALSRGTSECHIFEQGERNLQNFLPPRKKSDLIQTEAAAVSN